MCATKPPVGERWHGGVNGWQVLVALGSAGLCEGIEGA